MKNLLTAAVALTLSACADYEDRYPADPVLAQACAARLGGVEAKAGLPTIISHEGYWMNEEVGWIMGLYDPATDTLEYTDDWEAFSTLVHEFTHRQDGTEDMARRAEERIHLCFAD